MTEQPIEFEQRAQPSVVVEKKGFRPSELLKVEGSDLRSASLDFGEEMKEVTRSLLEEYKAHPDYQAQLAQAAHSLEQLRGIAKSGSLTTSDGVDRIARYLEALEGYCEGVGVSLAEGALLQLGGEAGCQTLIVQNSKTGKVVGLHTEEDADEYQHSKDPKTGKRWVEMTIGDRTIQFCTYVGFCSFGPASGVIEEKDGKPPFFQATDIIGPKGDGPLWANAVAFMTMDCGNIQLAEELVSKMKKLPQPIFNGGYVLHIIEGTKPPKVRTLEFGGSRAVFVEPERSGDRLIQLGVNYPRDPELQGIDDYTLSSELGEEKRIMKRRIRRLRKLGGLVGRRSETEEWWGERAALAVAHQVLRNPHGDWLGKWFSGLANDLVAQNDTLYVSPEGRMKLVVRRGYPKLLRTWKL